VSKPAARKPEKPQSVLIIGSGPIVIGQAAEFDYAGTQACKAMREEGVRSILVNSNPATIMTDEGVADAVYIEPLTVEVLRRVIERERPDGLLPTLGGQVGLNLAVELHEAGILEEFDVRLLGTPLEAIRRAEDRQLLREAMREIGEPVPPSAVVTTLAAARAALAEIGLPAAIRPAYTLGGTGGGFARTLEEFERIVRSGLAASPITQVLVERSLQGWKEVEYEVMRDGADTCITICNMENIDPMGVHTGDSITVAPAQTLSDREYQEMRNASIAVLREIGVDTGGSNVQFAVHPDSGRQVVIEMNPRVSRSSALASKATGFPIARIAAKLAVGFTLDELANEMTGGVTPASFEPSIDYVVTKMPRFAFEKFGDTEAVLGTQMKSVGEVMAIGRNFQESLHKAVRGLETGFSGLEPRLRPGARNARRRIERELRIPGPERLWYVADAFRCGMSVEEVYKGSAIDPWFLHWIEDLVQEEQALDGAALPELDAVRLRALKRKGFSDARLAALLGCTEGAVRTRRRELGVRPAFKRVDTCAASHSSSYVE